MNAIPVRPLPTFLRVREFTYRTFWEIERFRIGSAPPEPAGPGLCPFPRKSGGSPGLARGAPGAPVIVAVWQVPVHDGHRKKHMNISKERKNFDRVR